MKRYVYRNHEFNGYEITVSGSVYKRDAKGALKRIKGLEARTQIALFFEHRRRNAANEKAGVL